MKKQRSDIIEMIQDLSLVIRKHIPTRRSLDDLENELFGIREKQMMLNDYLEYLKYEIIKHRVRPGKERISILKEEQQLLMSSMTRFKENLVQDSHAYQRDDRYTMLCKMMQEQDLFDLKMKSLLDILDQVVGLQESYDSIEPWINRTKDSTHYIKELEVRMKCYTSQERLDSLLEMQSIRRFESQLFNQTPFQKDLYRAVHCKKDLMVSVQRLENILEEKYRNYIFMLWNQKRLQM